MTPAEVFHGPCAEGEVTYAQRVAEGDAFHLGKLVIKVLETPGHTDDSLSFAVYDKNFGEDAVAVLTGDALFIGDVGRTDFYPDRAAEVAGLLYDSLGKILALGDQAIVYPAHGAGSVCGHNMADREFSTLGYERRHNPMLQIRSRRDFIESKLGEHHYLPPYFRNMECLNLEGAPPPRRVFVPAVISASEVEALSASVTIVDLRGVAAFLGAHLPGSLALPVDMLPAFAGWFLEPDEELLLVSEDVAQAETAARHLSRIGYDRVFGCVKSSMPAWAAMAKPFETLPVVDADEVAQRVTRAAEDWVLLDVRGQSEVDAGIIPGAKTIYLGELPGRLGELDPDSHVTVMCASGARATIAASLLRRGGFSRVDVFLGSMGAWKGAGHEVVDPS
jgi:hydroxyacylglutathione hydrolase